MSPTGTKQRPSRPAARARTAAGRSSAQGRVPARRKPPASVPSRAQVIEKAIGDAIEERIANSESRFFATEVK